MSLLVHAKQVGLPEREREYRCNVATFQTQIGVARTAEANSGSSSASLECTVALLGRSLITPLPYMHVKMNGRITTPSLGITADSTNTVFQ